MRSSASRAQDERDLLRAWAAALNITVEDFPAGDEQAARRALDAYPRPEFVRAHVQLLVEHAEADPARLAATAEAARVKHAELTATGQTGERTRHYLTAAILAERGLAVIREAGAEHDPAAQQKLAETISAGWFPQPDPFRPGLLDRHRLPRRLARRLNPRWHYRRLRVRAAHLDVRPAATADRTAMITIKLHGHQIGRLGFLVCDTCRKGLICKESISSEYQGLGLGRRALLAALATAPDFEWTTTPQYETSVRYWQRMSRATGASLTDDPAQAGPRPAPARTCTDGRQTDERAWGWVATCRHANCVHPAWAVGLYPRMPPRHGYCCGLAAVHPCRATGNRG